MDMSLDTQRSQLANYAKRGWLERIAEGVYMLTESGAQKCGYSEKNEAPEGASVAGEVEADESGELFDKAINNITKKDSKEIP